MACGGSKKGFVSAKEGLRKSILEEAHKSNFAIHLGMTKMYHDLKRMFWWPRMKTDKADLVGKCLVCQKVRSNIISPCNP